jgi:hypothetical protein
MSENDIRARDISGEHNHYCPRNQHQQQAQFH